MCYTLPACRTLYTNVRLRKSGSINRTADSPVSESVFSAAVGVGVGGYTWGAPTPPPGSPYSPVPVTQLELLAKNLANLAPAAAAAGQQALSLQGVGVNVAGSLHHAQHTQHTQHTLNLTGLHHLHHGESARSSAFRVGKNRGGEAASSGPKIFFPLCIN